MVLTWIREENLEPFVEIVAGFVKYQLDRDELFTLRAELRDTDVEANNWYEYPLLGTPVVQLAIARDQGSAVVSVRAESDLETEAKIQVTMDIAATYWLSRVRREGAVHA